jgi:tRNA G18 (ribose-2'-O)-methylase SpoU
VHFHQGCLALARRPAPRRVEEVVGAPTGPGLWLVLEGVTDPDNVGTLFRSGAAFGVRAVLIGPASAHPLYRKALRTSLGTVLGVPFAEAGDWEADLARLAAAGIERVALTPDATAPSLAEAVARAGPRVALLLGSEERGLSPGTLATAEIRARIPLAAEVDSLNVAAAGAIALYAFAAGGDDPGRGA